MSQIHMKFAKILMVILGIWPLQLSGYKQKIYNAYFYLTFTYYIIFNATMAAKVYISDGNFVETATNLNVTIVYVINIYKVLICRSKAMKKIIGEMRDREMYILEGTDEAIKGIYKKHAKSAFVSAAFMVIVGTCGISLYFISPIVKNYVAKKNGITDKRKDLIFLSWFPFDSDQHYLAAYLIQFVDGFYGYAYIAYVGAFFFCIMKFVVGQLNILQHMFKNFNYYVSNNVNHKEKYAQEVFIKLCIREHQYLINLVERLDESLKTFMLLEFIVSSFQLSLVVYQILQSNGGTMERVAVFSYLATLSTQLFFFYWHAHDIIIESTNISGSVFECDWSTLDPKVQKMLILVIQRAQKPIGISIGPINTVRLESLVAIYKAIYSYVAVIQK